MTQFLNPFSGRQFIDANGNPYSGAKLFTYVAGTTTKITTTKDQAGVSNHANPIILNTRGEPAETGGSSAAFPIWQPGGQAIKLVLAPSNDTDPPGSPISTWDNISGINDTSTTLDQWIAGPTSTFVSSTSFTLVGDQTTNFHIGRRVKLQDSGGTDYGTITNSVFGALTTVTVVVDGGGALDSGLSNIWYGIVGKANTSVPRLDEAISFCEGRLTLTSVTPVTTSDVTAATTIYFTPYRGNRIALFNSIWKSFAFSELSLAVPSTTNTMYDVFAFNSSGTPAIEAIAWTNDTTRATALVLQDGVLVKSGDTTRRYIGSFRTAGVSGQAEDSAAKRYVWNYYNRVHRALIAAAETANTWNYTTATWRQANANTANQLDVVIGYSEDIISVEVHGGYFKSVASGGATPANVGIGVNSTSVDSSTARAPGSVPDNAATAGGYYYTGAYYKATPSVGRNFYAWLERANAVNTVTWVGDNGDVYSQSRIIGEFIM